jgi:protein transport protein SEC13
MDYYGKRLATCSSDRTVKLFLVQGETHTLIKELRGYAGSSIALSFLPPPSPFPSPLCLWPWVFDAMVPSRLVKHAHRHEGPVWQVAWAHPKFGNILASCGYDCKAGRLPTPPR